MENWNSYLQAPSTWPWPRINSSSIQAVLARESQHSTAVAPQPIMLHSWIFIAQFPHDKSTLFPLRIFFVPQLVCQYCKFSYCEALLSLIRICTMNTIWRGSVCSSHTLPTCRQVYQWNDGPWDYIQLTGSHTEVLTERMQTCNTHMQLMASACIWWMRSSEMQPCSHDNRLYRPEFSKLFVLCSIHTSLV